MNLIAFAVRGSEARQLGILWAAGMKEDEVSEKIAIVGSGLVGSGWAIVFSRAGFDVALYDYADGGVARARGIIGERLRDLESVGLIRSADDVFGRIMGVGSLDAALEGATYVQESTFEDVNVKRKVFSDIERVADVKLPIGSSSSGIPASAFTEHLASRDRCLVAHPVNPPYLIPVVELVPAPWTSVESVSLVYDLMNRVGQSPVRMSREAQGFIVNRLQGVLLMEAWRLVEEGVASVDDVDRAVADGLGLRWSFMGPFETTDLNAPKGIAEYAERLGPLYREIAASRTTHEVWGPKLIAEVERQRRELLPEDRLGERSGWRDRRLMRLMLHKREMEQNE